MFPSQYYLLELVVYIACVRARGVTAVIYTRDSPATSSIALSRVHQERNRSLTATWSWTYFYKCSLNVFSTTYLRFPFQEWAHQVYKATLWLSTLYTVMYIIHCVPLSVSHRTRRKNDYLKQQWFIVFVMLQIQSWTLLSAQFIMCEHSNDVWNVFLLHCAACG